MAFIAQDIQNTVSDAEQLLKATVPRFRQTDAFTGSRTLGNPSQATTAKLAASMAGMVPAMAGMVSADLNGKLAALNAKLAASMAGMVSADLDAKLAASMAGMVPAMAGMVSADLNGKLAALNAKLAASMAGMVSADLNAKLAANGVLQDLIEMQTRLAAIARTVPSDSLPDTEFGTTLSRNSERLLFGNYVYCLVLSLVLLAYIRVIGESETDSQIFSIFIFATGLGAHQFAKLAREAAFRTYDFLFPLE